MARVNFDTTFPYPSPGHGCKSLFSPGGANCWTRRILATGGGGVVIEIRHIFRSGWEDLNDNTGGAKEGALAPPSPPWNLFLGGAISAFSGGAWAMHSPPWKILGGAIARLAHPGFAPMPLVWSSSVANCCQTQENIQTINRKCGISVKS